MKNYKNYLMAVLALVTTVSLGAMDDSAREIRIKTLTGKEFSVVVFDDITVKELKMRIHDSLLTLGDTVEPFQMRLVCAYDSRELSNRHEKLSRATLTGPCLKIHLVQKIKGRDVGLSHEELEEMRETAQDRRLAHERNARAREAAGPAMQRYQDGAFVIVTMPRKKVVGRVINFDPELHLYLVECGLVMGEKNATEGDLEALVPGMELRK
jgi:hypothetical protein